MDNRNFPKYQYTQIPKDHEYQKYKIHDHFQYIIYNKHNLDFRVLHDIYFLLA